MRTPFGWGSAHKGVVRATDEPQPPNKENAMSAKSLIAALLIAGSALAPMIATSAHAAGDSRDSGLLSTSIYAFHRANAGFPEPYAQSPTGGRLSERQNYLYDGNNGLFPVQSRDRSLGGLIFGGRR
jgi:hypothetical protein